MSNLPNIMSRKTSDIKREINAELVPWVRTKVNSRKVMRFIKEIMMYVPAIFIDTYILVMSKRNVT